MSLDEMSFDEVEKDQLQLHYYSTSKNNQEPIAISFNVTGRNVIRQSGKGPIANIWLVGNN
jgi:hypothetical protein